MGSSARGLHRAPIALNSTVDKDESKQSTWVAAGSMIVHVTLPPPLLCLLSFTGWRVMTPQFENLCIIALEQCFTNFSFSFTTSHFQSIGSTAGSNWQCYHHHLLLDLEDRCSTTSTDRGRQEGFFNHMKNAHWRTTCQTEPPATVCHIVLPDSLPGSKDLEGPTSTTGHLLKYNQ